MDRTFLWIATVCLLGCGAREPQPVPTPADPSATAREAMVRRTIERPSDGRPPVRDAAVLAALRAVPRHRFVPAPQAREAYADHPLPIGHGQTISQPYIVALMTEQAQLKPDDVVLEVGTGSGYQAAVLAEIVAQVYTIEIVEPLAHQAARDLAAAGYSRVEVRAGDGYAGWPEHAPFDAILVTAAPDHVPEPLKAQLAVGGRMVLPVGPDGGIQELIVLEKQPDGRLDRTVVMPVRFVPFTGPGVQSRDGEP